MRVIALSGGYSRKESCKMLKANANMIAGFGRAFLEGLTAKQKDAEFGKTLDQLCNVAFNASKFVDVREEQIIKLTTQNGFIVGFDQDEKSMPKLLNAYGIDESQYPDEASMMEKAHQFHTRVILNAQFNGSRCIGVILTEYAIVLNIGRLPTARYLWEVKRIVPFIKLDKGLAPEEEGVRLMKDMRDVEQKLDRAKSFGIFGTIARSTIRLPTSAGVRSVVNQQMVLAKQVLAKGLVPIVQIEVDIKSPDKAKCERLLVSALIRAFEELDSEQRVILDLTLPANVGTYKQLIKHANVMRVAALSGGYTRDEAVNKLRENVGMVASFGRAFAEGLHVTQTENQLTSTIVQTCNQLYNASRVAEEPVKVKDDATEVKMSLSSKQGEPLSPTSRTSTARKTLSRSAQVEAAAAALLENQAMGA
jgi:fructose-bisphosphate aldolase class I